MSVRYTDNGYACCNDALTITEPFRRAWNLNPKFTWAAATEQKHNIFSMILNDVSWPCLPKG